MRDLEKPRICFAGEERVRTLEDTDGGREVVDTASGLQGSSEDLNGGDKIVSEAVVQVALKEGRCVSIWSVKGQSICVTGAGGRARPANRVAWGHNGMLT